jgi:N-acetylglucosaminyldiphosphoundecaprenol N-acetyl-beta-D-mannosaminyltransferase
VRATGLEWAFRFLQEPRRLWRRYLKHNPRFLALALTNAGPREV